nr:MAG TPA: hypothetical protein [Caudoviricetes sp.]
MGTTMVPIFMLCPHSEQVILILRPRHRVLLMMPFSSMCL